ncbi:MAG: tripartite tricarboxylate transporter substrate binding protein [Burkholderiales bacterium]
MRKIIHPIARWIGLAAMGISGVACAQPYPAKAIRWIVPFPPGGGTDFVVRTLAQKLSEALGQQVVADNRPGSSGTIGLDVTAKAPADGYTIALGQTGNLALAPVFYPKLPYDPRRDFAPITRVSMAPFMLVAHPSLPAKNVRELIALAKTRPDEIAFGSSGNGSLSHLAGEIIKSAGGVRMLHVPYKGVALATSDLFSGRIALYVSPLQNLQGWFTAGRVKPIGLTRAQRSSAFPDVPTIAESGLPGYDVTNWYGVVAPAKTPAPVVARLNSELTRILRLPDVQARFRDEGGEVAPGTPEELSAFINREIQRWGKVVSDAGVRVE